MSQPAVPAAQDRFRAPKYIVWTAFLVRVAYITLAHTYRINPYQDHFTFGAEMGRIARALATGYGYSDPFHLHTGPTAWVTPLYPLLLAAVFKLFGVYTQLSAWVILTFDSLLNSLLIPLLWETAARCFNLRVARWSAWIWALYPAAMQYAVKWVWEMTLTALLFQLAFVLALRIAKVGNRPNDGPTTRRWLAFGLVWGLIALSNPGLLLFLPVCGLWMLASSGRAWPAQLPKAILAALLCLAIILPWSWRNTQIFGTFVPLRTNFGAELYFSNGPGAQGFLMLYRHPSQNPAELDLYHQKGELAYAALRGAEARQIIHADPMRFLRLCLTRAYFFWFGVPNPGGHPFNDFARDLNYSFASIAGLLGLALALRKKIPAAGLMAAGFLLIPIAYYIVAANARFRHPLEPLITVLAVYLFQQAQPAWGFTLPILRRLWPVKS